MEDTFIKLLKIVSSYTVFEEDQVLTADQLNRLTSYLDQQCRLSRVNLLGIGKVCGLHVRFDGKSVTITRGCAVTSDGDLLFYGRDMLFTHVKPFKDRNANYPYFVDQTREIPQQVPLFELLGANEGKTAAQGTPITDTEGLNLDTMAVVLYLEGYEFDRDICTGGECDNKGKEQRNNLKALLISQDDLKSIMERSRGKATPLPEYYFGLRELDIRRVLLDPNKVDGCPDLAEAYRDAMLNDTAIGQIIKVLQESYDICEPLLKEIYREGNPAAGTWKNTVKSLMGVRHTGIQIGSIQYVYDFFKDIIATHNEFVEALYGSTAICCPDIQLFPKHIMLGRVTGQSGPDDPYCHRFYESPLLNNSLENLRKAQFLHKRIDQMMNAFSLPDADQPIRITPSRSPEYPLSLQSIPCYYRIDRALPLNENWNFELHLRRKDDTLYSYHADRYTEKPKAIEPLKYSLEEYPFFRIEGHLGKKSEDAQSQLNSIIARYNLPIKVFTLQIENDVRLLKPRPLSRSWDLKALHQLYRKELIQHLKDVRSFNSRVKETLQEGAGVLPSLGNIKDRRVSYKSFYPYNDVNGTLEETIDRIDSNLHKNLAEFDHHQFETDYRNMITMVADINKNIKIITDASAFTPFESVVNDTQFSRLTWINDILKKREEKSKELSIFAKFLKEHPAMEHLSGTGRGGTFILVYSSHNDTVVADFSLPYWLSEPDESEEEMVEAEGGKIPWTELNNFGAYLHVGQEHLSELESLLNGRISAVESGIGNVKTELDGKISHLDGKIEGTVDSGLKRTINEARTLVDTYQSSMVNYIRTITPPATSPEVKPPSYTDPELNSMNGILENIKGYQDALNEKEKTQPLSDDEIGIRKELDAMTGSMIKRSIALLSSRETDIEAGSEEEKLIRKVGQAVAAIQNQSTKDSLSKEIQGVQKAAPGKDNFRELLNKEVFSKLKISK